MKTRIVLILSSLWFAWCGFRMIHAGSPMQDYRQITTTIGMETIQYLPHTRSLIGWGLMFGGFLLLAISYPVFVWNAYAAIRFAITRREITILPQSPQQRYCGNCSHIPNAENCHWSTIPVGCILEKERKTK